MKIRDRIDPKLEITYTPYEEAYAVDFEDMQRRVDARLPYWEEFQRVIDFFDNGPADLRVPELRAQLCPPPKMKLA